jgi:putative oxidoreductase
MPKANCIRETLSSECVESPRKSESGGWSRESKYNVVITTSSGMAAIKADPAQEKTTMKKLMSTNNDVALTILRLVLGIVFFAHGSQKMLGWFGGFGFHGTMGFFTNMGMPAPMAFLIICTEFFGGLGLIFGLLTRIAALGIDGLMIGAIFMVHLQNGFFMNWMGTQKGEGFEFHLLAIGMAAALLLRGAGAFSLDRALSK